jgi:hypothetical protein
VQNGSCAADRGAMHAGMMREGGVPGMENRDDADAGAEVLGVGRDLERWYSAVTCWPSAPLHSSKSCLGGFTPRFQV